MNKRSECDYVKFSNLQQLPCDWSECSSNDSRYRSFCCKACGKVNVIDIEAAQPSSIGIGTLVLILVGIILFVMGTVTTQPQNSSVPSSEIDVFTK